MTAEDIMRTGFLMAASTIEKDVRLTDITENELSGLFTAQLKALTDAGYAVVPKIPTPEICEAGLFADDNKLLMSACCVEMFNAYKAMIETGAHKV